MAFTIAAGTASGGSKSPLAEPGAVSASTADDAHYSDPPTDQEILVSGVLPQPLAPVGGRTDGQENRALGRALIQYQQSLDQGAQPDAVGPLTDFLRSHPASRWRAALELNLGIIYRRSGHMSKALAAWQHAWDLSKRATEPNARAIADYSVGELAEFEAYLGRMETLAPLLAEVRARPMHGAGAANISNASQGLAEMRTRPQDAFRCGPMALHRICLLQKRTDGVMALERSRSTTRGTSLVQVVELAHKVGLDYQMAYREPGAVLIVPAVMHWKVGHFAAVIKQSGGLYQVEDPTFGENIRVSRATLDEEASGYFAVPAGPLPKGWRSASRTEGQQIWGRGVVTGLAQATVNWITSFFTKCRTLGMTTANAQASTVSLTLQDAPLSYQTSKGRPFSFELAYSHRDAQQPAIFTYTNFGPKWTSNWISYFTNNVSSTNTADLYAAGGGVESYVFSGDTNPRGGLIFVPGPDDQALVTSLVSAGKTVGFTRELPDGSIQTFAQRLGSNQFFLSSVADPQGNKVTLTYDGFIRITTITDAAGDKTTLSYGLASDKYKVTKVTDPFGRSATFTYNSDGELASITDSLGITSSYTYLFDSGDFIASLTTPYGVSKFTYGDSSTDYRLDTTVFLTMTDPLGQMQRVEFRQQAPGIGFSDPPNTVPAGMGTFNQYLSFRNTFVWTAHQLALAILPSGEYDYTKAKIFHWDHLGSSAIGSGVPESIKEPLENRVWYNYPNQAGGPARTGSSNQPTAIGRVLDDGSTQLLTFQRNSFGLITQVTDPIGRQRTLTYAANGIDLVSLANTTGGANQLLLSATYNGQHEPLTVTDPSGQVTKLTYNTAGQVLTQTDPLKETTSYTYSAAGLQLSTVRPFTGAVTKYTYDGFNRLRSATDFQGYQLLFGYDAADRPTSIKYPDTTTVQLVYKLLDLASVSDRLKRKTNYTYDSLRRLTQVKDPLGRTTTLGYCDCGAVSKLIDPNGNVTDFIYDIQERLAAKVFPDGTSTALTYELTTSRIRSQTDALGQVTLFTYNVDDTPRAKTYLHAIHPTASVSYSWDVGFRRLISMIDGGGKTTYTYNPITSTPVLGAGLPGAVKGARGDTQEFAYDALGRAVKVTLDGAASQFTFDSLGRVTSDQNPLDTFTVGYVGATDSPASVQSGKGPSSKYAYFGNTGDERLKGISNNSFGGALMSAFLYSYDADGEVTSTVIQKQFAGTITRTMSYDAAGQLTGVTAAGGGSNYTFGYDTGANRTSEKAGLTTTAFAYNKLNELTSPGPATYDKVGEPLVLGSTSFQWDAAGRVIVIRSGTKITKFAYDGFDRRTRITRLTGTTVTSDKFYFWCGNDPCLETDPANHVTKRYFSEGVVDNGQPLYYARDNLGSVRGLINSSGIVTASFDYDPYGVRSRVAGTADSDFGFAGFFHESQSGLDLALYRAYDSSRGRWLNRDPIGEDGGVNLYSYVSNDPIGLMDPLGLACFKLGESILKRLVFATFTTGVGVLASTFFFPAAVVTGGAIALSFGISTTLGVLQDYVASDPNYVEPDPITKNLVSSGRKTAVNFVATVVILGRFANPPTALATATSYAVSVLAGLTLDGLQGKTLKFPPPKPVVPLPQALTRGFANQGIYLEGTGSK